MSVSQSCRQDSKHLDACRDRVQGVVYIGLLSLTSSDGKKYCRFFYLEYVSLEDVVSQFHSLLPI